MEIEPDNQHDHDYDSDLEKAIALSLQAEQEQQQKIHSEIVNAPRPASQPQTGPMLQPVLAPQSQPQVGFSATPAVVVSCLTPEWFSVRFVAILFPSLFF